MKKEQLTIVIDFDGTVVKHQFPLVGADIGAAPILRRVADNGHKLILSTMRSTNTAGYNTLQPALDWFADNQIPLYAVNENPDQTSWTTSPKIDCDVLIDDLAVGAPLMRDDDGSVHMDWTKVPIYLFAYGALTQNDLYDLNVLPIE